MKKKILLGTGVVFTIATSFYAGSAFADTNFISQITYDATHAIVSHGHDKANELVNNIDDKVKAKLQDKVDQKVDTKNQEVDTQLQTYYDKKIDEFVNSDNATIDQPLEASTTNAIVIGENDIDKAFASLSDK